MAATALENLHATALTTRSHNPFFRCEQLKSLHDTLRGEIDPIRDALRQDHHVTDAEATVEVATALRHLKSYYAAIDPKAELESEYRTKKAQDAHDRAEPWGVVYIEPELDHTPFLSVIEPLGAAIAAGNCVALKLENTPRTLPSLLRSLLTKALQPDVFQIISTSPQDLTSPNLLSVLQRPHTANQSSHTALVSSSGRVIAVVDRTADLPAAADALVAARFSFGATSPYAPDLVLVNEFAKRDFTEHVLRSAIRYLAAASTPDDASQSQSQSQSPLERRSASDALSSIADKKDWKSTVITHGSAGAIVELVSTRTTHAALPPKMNAPVLAIAAVSSLDHAIDMVSNDSDHRLSAAFHFAAPAQAKYLAQFIRADASFVNHVPSSLLLGPGAPVFHTVDAENRYTTAQFVRTSPVLVRAPGTQVSLAAGVAAKEAAKLLGEAAKEIKEAKRAESIAIGFFEQGIFIGLGLYGVPILTCLGASLFFGVRAGLKRFSVI